VADDFKKSRDRGALIVFADEAGFSMVPCLKATWAPLGRTPVVRHRNRWHRKVSVIGAIAIEPDGSSFQLLTDWHPDRHVTQVEVAAFCGKLLKQFPHRPLTLVWDKLQAHRGAMVKQFVAEHPRIDVHVLPSYAPDLNPVEMVWCLGKHHGMANHGIDDLGELCAKAKRRVQGVGRRATLLKACVAHAGLLDALCQTSAQ
jgi:putative transposase